MMTNLVLKVFS